MIRVTWIPLECDRCDAAIAQGDRFLRAASANYCLRCAWAHALGRVVDTTPKRKNQFCEERE